MDVLAETPIHPIKNDRFRFHRSLKFLADIDGFTFVAKILAQISTYVHRSRSLSSVRNAADCWFVFLFLFSLESRQIEDFGKSYERVDERLEKRLKSDFIV